MTVADWEKHEGFQEIQYSAIPFDDRRIAEELIQAKLFNH